MAGPFPPQSAGVPPTPGPAPLPEPEPHPQLMRALGRLVRGLSALFWGLPTALIVCFHTARADSLRWFGLLPPLVCTALLLYALCLLGAFQRQERVWRNALDRARVLALVNCGLSPFLYFWNKIPGNSFFSIVLLVFALSGLLFLGSLNLVLQRLGAMLPDEALRLEAKQFTAVSVNLVGAAALLGFVLFVLTRFSLLPNSLSFLRRAIDQNPFWLLALLVPLVLLPLAMTMALLWKTKEVILDSVFCARPPAG